MRAIISIPVIIISIPGLAIPTMVAHARGSGMMIAGISTSISSSAISGGNTGNKIETGDASAKVSSKVIRSGNDTYVKMEASAETEGERVEVRATTTGQEIDIHKETPDGKASIDLSVDAMGDGVPADLPITGDTPSGSDDSESGLTRETVDGTERDATGSRSWWDIVRGIFGRLFRR
ncbi:MAG: hypothetical protein HGA31_04305 [Candidatus Moranbacteria bacterium]|nr:hypothetical protein [Candidatus Moranbacteria bacterium]